jgi:hypothetical protein
MLRKTHQARRHLTCADTLQVVGIDVFLRGNDNSSESDTKDNCKHDSKNDPKDDSKDDSEDDHEDDPKDSCEDNPEDVQELDKLRWNLNARFRDIPDKHGLKPEEFDLINSRFLADGINKERWEPLVREYKLLLKPGGWLQMTEAQWKFHSRSGQDLPALKEWSETYHEGLRRMRKVPNIAGSLEQIVRFAGFEHVSATTYDIQVESWRPGTRSRALILTLLRMG